MRGLVLVLGWIILGVAALLAVAGISAWPPGGPMFALPYVFLIPAALLGVVGVVLVLAAGRSPSAASSRGRSPGI